MKQEDKYLKGKERIAKQKSFYNHLQIFVIITFIILFFSNTIFNFFENQIQNPNTLKWAKANIWINILLWGIGIIVHGIFAFNDKITFIKNWENRKIKEILKEEK